MVPIQISKIALQRVPDTISWLLTEGKQTAVQAYYAFPKRTILHFPLRLYTKLLGLIDHPLRLLG